MRIKSISVQNFASYSDLSLNFDASGLTLIQGANGAGKSTLCDVIPWILYGKTSKGGTVDEIRTWDTRAPSTGTVEAEIGNGILQVTRVRGKTNDLYYSYDNGGDILRGKDIPDTQKIINSILGIDYDLYLAGSYFHEFSQTAQFFTTSAKNRRQICEQLVDLSLAVKLKDKASEQYKAVNLLLQVTNQSISDDSFKLQHLKTIQIKEQSRAADWEAQQDKTREYLAAQYEKFESARKKIISNQCKSCGTILAKPREVMDLSDNPYMTRLEHLTSEVNPFIGQVVDYSNDIQTLEDSLEVMRAEQSQLKLELDDLDVLQSVINDYRSTSITRTISEIETNTNKLLTNHFDAEIKINFTVESADKLEVIIYKDGNVCSYTQLSKGQRCLLKLCFGVSVMQSVQNHHGMSFNCLWFDEALDGLSEAFKAKAYRLLETIAVGYENVFVVEHSEGLKSLFANSITVELINGRSVTK